jgi:phospholipid/cholesterol/gamma-HCH transport system ATP-binding protein
MTILVGFGKRVMIDHLSLDVRRGEILGLVGASGGGKSVLMRTIIGLIARQGGEIEVMGVAIGSNHTIAAPRPRRPADGASCSSKGALFSSLTVRQNVQFPMRENLVLSDATARRDRQRQAGNGRAGAGGRRQVSVGVVRRHDARGAGACAGARSGHRVSSMSRPRDSIRSPPENSTYLIKTLQKTLGLTVFMVTHDLASLNTVCDRVAALADGKIVAIGPMSELMQSEHPWVRAYFHGKRSLMLQPKAS